MEDAVKADEYFYSATLEKNGSIVTWGQKDREEFSSSADRLHLRQILLGHTAKADEYNVVEVETASVHGTVKIPIAVLKVGELRAIQSNLEFPDGPVTFKLIEGNGPVYIHGQQLPNAYEDELAGEDAWSEEELGDEEEGDEAADENPRKKHKLNNDKNNKPKNSNKKSK